MEQKYDFTVSETKIQEFWKEHQIYRYEENRRNIVLSH